MSDSDAGLINDLLATKAPYPVKSSQLAFGTRIGVQPIYWLDNDRAMFAGYAVERHIDADGKESYAAPPIGIYIWNVKLNTSERYADITNAPRLFQYYRGEIAYTVERPDPHDNFFDVMVGKMGQEKHVTLKKGFVFYPELESSRGLSEGREGIFQLNPEHGYISDIWTIHNGRIDPRYSPRNVRLHRPGLPDPVELPITGEQMAGFRVTYADFLAKYVLVPGGAHAQDEGDPHSFPVYLISPDGTVETMTIPLGDWSLRYPGRAFMTREGLFWVSNQTHWNSRDAGGWLLKDGQPVKLFDQLVDGAGVSPDGCTIVYANNDHDPKTMEYVQAIELCAPKQ
jgi:hypothetical protein